MTTMHVPTNIVELQQRLAEAGIYGGAIDGHAGPMTTAALARWIKRLPQRLISPAQKARQINARGLELTKHFESLFLTAYKCPGNVWTVGWGHTGLRHKDGTVYPGLTITAERAEALLGHDMNVFEQRVDDFVKVPLTDDQFSALVSFDFNTGALGRSTLLRRLNAGDDPAAVANTEFEKYRRGGGRPLRGLLRRRWSERNLFLGLTPFIVPTEQTPRTYAGQKLF
jgi:GH24 family phage-related lysozyme (muramidase)